MARHHINACHVLWREICYHASLSHNVFDFTFLPQGLHNTPEKLRERVQGAIDDCVGDHEAILLGYGLCSNGLANIVARDKPLVIARAHDCITHLLGSKERYREYFDKHPGTYWYSPGWIDSSTMPGEERYARVRAQYVEKYGEENADYLKEMEQGWFERYTNAAYVDIGAHATETDRYKRDTKEAAEWLGWNYDELEGDPALIVAFLNGDWDDERFITVQPGEILGPSHDDGVLTIEPPPSP